MRMLLSLTLAGGALVLALWSTWLDTHRPPAQWTVMTASQQGQDRPAPPPGNPGHIEPQEGDYCAAGERVPAAHRCTCQPTCIPGTDDEGVPDGQMHRGEDKLCRWYCRQKVCTCPSPCDP